ncbi:hypothetical protein HYG81_07735 [Natrinema zhouii]|uniref:Uncharacterized protein n=1 Tax=Natrinema zhouii TaxID=1710539 RepID=A0A7D6GLR0_9EURY|nr:hypothetical protein [Natrinema zhouii]QLK27479.1 hypothetical protein HYG81_07735 [Natrinema zhouii]
MATLAALLAGGALVLWVGDRTIGTVPRRSVWPAVVVLVVAGYLVAETVAAYRDTRPE